MWGILQTWEAHWALMFRVFIGTQSHKLVLADLLQPRWSLTASTWPKASTIYHVVGLSHVVYHPFPTPNLTVPTWLAKTLKRLCSDMTSQGLRDCLPAADSQGQTALGQGWHLCSWVSGGTGLAGEGVSLGEGWEWVLWLHPWIAEEKEILLYKMWCFQGLLMLANHHWTWLSISLAPTYTQAE